MASSHMQMDFPFRRKNKETASSRAYDDLFDQYIDPEILEPNKGHLHRPSSVGLSTPSSAIVESIEEHWPLCEPDQAHWETKQELQDENWAQTLRRLEGHDDEEDSRQYQIETDTGFSYPPLPVLDPDFLSLGGCPSPHISSATPGASSDRYHQRRTFNAPQSFQRPIEPTTGIRKILRNCKSIPNMMTPSRYRSGFREAWRDRKHAHPGLQNLRMPFQNAPGSPPSSADNDHLPRHHALASFATASVHPSALFDDDLPPLPTRSPHAYKEQIDTLHMVGRTASRNTATWAHNGLGPRGGGHAAGPYTAPLEAPTPWFDRASDDDILLSPLINPWSAAHDSPHQPASNTHMTLAEPIDLFEESMPTSSMDMPDATDHFDPVLMTSFDNVSLADPTEHSLRPMSMPSPYYTNAAEAVSNRRSLYQHIPRPRSPSPSPPAPSTSRSRSRARVPSTSQSRSRSRHRSAKSRTRGQSVPRTPRKRRSASRSADFVNLTAADSSRLLAGVAPSGSSKTKARREKEANERRRKMSVAAVRAVIDAGGDLDALRDAGLVD